MSLHTLAAVALLSPLVAALLLAPPLLRRRGKLAAALSIFAASLSAIGATGLLANIVRFTVSDEHPSSFFAGVNAHWLPVPGAEVGFLADSTSALMLVVVAWVALAVQIFSFGYLSDEPPPALGRYYALHSLFLFSMSLLVLAPNLLQAFIGWELVGASSFLLIGYWWGKASAARASLKAFWVTKLADSGFIVALIVMHSSAGTFDWNEAVMSAGVATAVAALLFLAIMGKSAQVPLHVWLPDAMEGPTPVSALLHAATMVAAGVFLTVRAWPIFANAPAVLTAMAHVGAITAFFAACVALVQTDIKRVLAYSTCSQLGFMFAALGSGAPFAGFFHLVTHAAFKALLFLAAGSVIHAVHSNELADMGGLFRKMRFTAITFIVGALALSGIPPFAGFFSKDAILEAATHRGLPVVIALLVATAFLTALYMGRVVLRAFFGAPSKAADHAHESGPTLLAPLALLAVASLTVGFAGPAMARLLGSEHEFHLGALGIVALVLSLGGLAVAFALERSGRAGAVLAPVALVANSRAIDRAWLLGYQRVVLVVSRGFAWIDRYVIDGVMNVAGWVTVVAGRKLRPIQSGRVADYAWILIVAVALIAAYGALR